MRREEFIAISIALAGYFAIVFLLSGSSLNAQFLRELIPTESVSALAFALSFGYGVPTFLAYVIGALVLFGIPCCAGLTARMICVKIKNNKR